MPKATDISTTPLGGAATRRNLLGRAGAAIGFAALPVAARAAATPADPIPALYAEWLALEDAQRIADERFMEVRALLVSRYGDLVSRGQADALWVSDPLDARLNVFRERSDELCGASTNLLDVMMETPATSLEGVRCKLLTAVSVCSCIKGPYVDPDSVEYTDIMTLAFLRNAVRVLGGSAVA